jgi:hypothetical protein
MIHHTAALSLLSLIATGTLQGWTGAQVNFPGEGPGWDLGAASDSYKYSGPDGSTEWFRMEWTAPATNADYDFKMVTGDNWAQDYGGNLIFPKNQLALLYYQPLGDSAAKLSGGVIAGKRYIHTVKDPGLANTFSSVMELSAAPISITGVSRNTSTGLITVTLTVAGLTPRSCALRSRAAQPLRPFRTSRMAAATSGTSSPAPQPQTSFTTTTPRTPSHWLGTTTVVSTTAFQAFNALQTSPSTVPPGPTRPPSSSSTS